MGAKIAYYLILLPLSWLPYFLLYRISDLLYLVFLTIFPYRKKVVLANLNKAFPEKDDAEIKRISRRYYRHLADIIVESFKNFSISEEQAQKRMKPVNNKEVSEILNSGQGVALCGGHFNNWELYAVAGAAHVPGKVMAIYKRIQNAFFDQKMRSTRGRFGLTLVPTVEASQWMKDIAANEAVTVVYGIDQSPANPKKAYWIDFFGHKTAAYYGAEKHARSFNMAVVFGAIHKIKRGHYEMRYEVITRDPASLRKGEIIEIVNRKLEGLIREAPEYWLWSHKRWKHSWKPEYAEGSTAATT